MSETGGPYFCSAGRCFCLFLHVPEDFGAEGCLVGCGTVRKVDVSRSDFVRDGLTTVTCRSPVRREQPASVRKSSRAPVAVNVSVEAASTSARGSGLRWRRSAPTDLAPAGRCDVPARVRGGGGELGGGGYVTPSPSPSPSGSGLRGAGGSGSGTTRPSGPPAGRAYEAASAPALSPPRSPRSRSPGAFVGRAR